MNSVEQATELLRARGYRITKSRLQVLEALLSSEKGLNRQEIIHALEDSGRHVDTVSVYRTLLLLEGEGLAHRLPDTNSYVACRLEKSGCHHHIQCNRCGKVAEVPCDGMDAIYELIGKLSNFEVQSHQLEFRGLCEQCSQEPIRRND